MRAREFIVEDNESRTEEFHGVNMKITDDGYEVIASAFDDWDREMGSVVFNKGDGNELDPQDLLVIDKFRGQGVAKVMYDYVKSKGYEIHKSPDVTKIADQGKESGEYFWQKNRGEERIWEGINPDILNKRFNHTQVIDNYTYVASVEIFLDDPLLHIKAYNELNKEIGHALFQIFDWEDNPDDGYLESGGTRVHSKYRNEGIASTMYAYAKMLGNDIRPSSNRTGQGKAMWAAWDKSGDSKHLSTSVVENRENFNGVNILFQKDDDEIFVKASAGGKELGHVLFVMDGDYLMPQDLEVEERFRGQGIAQTMYDFVKSKGYKIRRSGQQTDAGAGFWKKHRPDQNIWEQEVDENWKSTLATGAITGAMAMGASAKAPNMVQQIVEPGDTVYSIARQNNINPLEIYKLNKMSSNTKLEIGQKVLVPDYSKSISKMPATVTPIVKQEPAKVAQPIAQPTTSFRDKITSMIPKFSQDKDEDEGVILLSDNSDAEAALQTAAKAAGLKGTELAQFMAQTRHESWDFSKMKEVGNKKRFAKYETPRKAKQLGNKLKGDGERFKGRGFIQLTGRDNYTRASQQIFGDDRLVKNPDLASRLDVGAQIALWFWKNQVRPNVNDFNNTKEVTNAINPGLSGLQDRHNKFKEYMAVL